MHVTTSALGRRPHISVKSSIRLLSAWKEKRQASPGEWPGADLQWQRTEKKQEPAPHRPQCPPESREGRGVPVGAGRGGGRHKQDDG